MDRDSEEIAFDAPMPIEDFIRALEQTTFALHARFTDAPKRPRSVPSPAEIWFNGRNWLDDEDVLRYPPRIRCGIFRIDQESIDICNLPIILVLN